MKKEGGYLGWAKYVKINKSGRVSRCEKLSPKEFLGEFVLKSLGGHSEQTNCFY